MPYSVQVNGADFYVGDSIIVDLSVGDQGGIVAILIMETGQVILKQDLAPNTTYQYQHTVLETDPTGTYLAEVAGAGNFQQAAQKYKVHAGAAPPAPTPVPTPTTGPQLQDCVFPTLQWNLIQVLSDLIEWIGCILHNIITILQWVIDWLLHFHDHLDAWASRLFGVDPALPFWDELEKKLIKMLISAAQQIVDILFADSDFWKNRKFQR